MTLERIQHEVDNLAHDMRNTNVRSLGLKTVVHEQWCQRMAVISKMVKQYQEEQQTVPPSPPTS